MQDLLGASVVVRAREADAKSAPEVQRVQAERVSRRGWDAVLVGILATTLSAYGSGRFLLGGDELTTISAATRPVYALWDALRAYDMHQGLYYLFMHAWFSVFPVTEFWSRLPSALAVGVAAAGVVVLGRQLSTTRVALTSGIVFALLPRVTYAGSDVRVFALSMALAVWVTVLVVSATRRNDRRWWLAYGISMVLGVVLYAHLVLIMPAHAVVAGMMSRDKRALHSWAKVTLAAGAAIVAFLLVARSGFPLWMPALGANTIADVLQFQYFERYPAYVSVLAGLILVVGLVSALMSGRAKPTPFVAVLLVWMAFPTLAMLAFSLLKPIYLPRYLSFTAPALALLLGLSIVTVVRSKTAIAGVLIVFAVAAIPNYQAQRQVKVKGNLQYAQFAEIIDENAARGDCVVYNEDSERWPPLRRMTYYRPQSFTKLTDPEFVELKGLHPDLRPFSKFADKLAGCRVVWSVSWRDGDMPDGHKSAVDPVGHRRAVLPPGAVWKATDSYKKLESLGFRPVDRWQFGGAQVIKSVR